MLPRAARLAAQFRSSVAAQHASFSTAAVAAAAGNAGRVAAVTGVGALGLGSFALVDEPLQVAYGAAMVPVRLGRDVVAAVSMLAGEPFTKARWHSLVAEQRGPQRSPNCIGRY